MACNCKNQNASALCCTGTTCTKTCIDVKKVFDACIQQTSVSETLTVDFGGEIPDSIVSVLSNGESTVSDVSIVPITGTPNSRVSYSVTTPLTVTATTATGTTITGTSEMTNSLDIVLCVPQNGVISPEIASTVIITGLQNTVESDTTVNTNACVTIITKVVADVILVIPAYGYPIIPPCQEYTQDACQGIFNSPVFPR